MQKYFIVPSIPSKHTETNNKAAPKIDQENLEIETQNLDLIDTLVNDPILVTESESRLQEYIDLLLKTPNKKKYDEDFFGLFEIDEELLLETLKIKNPIRPEGDTQSETSQEEQEFPMNLFLKMTYEGWENVFLSNSTRKEGVRACKVSLETQRDEDDRK